MRALWPRWTLLPPLPFVLWAFVQAARGSLRLEHVAMALAALALTYGNAKTKRLLIGIYPVGLVGVIYDVMSVVKHTFALGARAVHICDLRAAELRFFPVTMGGVAVTTQDFFQAHTSPWLDVVCSVPYALFIYAVLLFGTYLYFKSYDSLRALGWAFLLVNIAGFITYQAYPAAPPWYYHAHGCALDLAALPSEGPALARVDAMLGFRYFAAMYGRAATPFGAVPSLHVAYPMMMAFAGWRGHGKLGRGLLVGWYLWMCFAAVYLDHHWLIDIVVGSLYALVGSVLVRVFFTRGERHIAASPLPEPGR
jgi:membrane-associated phospholipid phosphatase